MIIKKYVFFALIFIILMGLLYTSIRSGVLEKASSLVRNGLREDKDDDNDDDSDDDPILNPDGSFKKTESQTEDGERKDSEISNSPPECILRTISYSLEDFEKSSICNSYQDADCIDKTVECSASVRNLDYDLAGGFEVIFNYRIVGAPETYSTDSKIKTVQPRAIEEFSSSIQIQGPEANQEITCSFETGDTPKKEICF